MDPLVRFPEGFLWGVATSAYQTEGGNYASDWWQWEHTPGSGSVEPSGDACDSWHRWPEDVALVADLGFTACRFAIDWARIEPEDGLFSRVALEHYTRICERLHARGILPIVTFLHFTLPRWVAARGGWDNPATGDLFARFCARAAAQLAPWMGRACTINEPNVLASSGYAYGSFPPGVKDVGRARTVHDLLIVAHRKAACAIRASAPGVPIGLTLNMAEYDAAAGGETRVDALRATMEDPYLAATTGDDFLGVQTYVRTRVWPDGTTGDEACPLALAATLRRAWQMTSGTVPLLVTEHGIATEDDAQRIVYLHAALQGVLDCMADGIDVRGYCHWSLFDTWEWTAGFRLKMGLVAVDRETFARTVKPSGYWLGRIARANTLRALA